MNSSIFGVILALVLGSISHLQGQEFVPQNFRFDMAARASDKKIFATEITQPGAHSMRLYFNNMDIGRRSYIILEGVDGSSQKLNLASLKNWSNSSAYFNGDRIKVSVFQGADEPIKFSIEQVRFTSAHSISTTQSKAQRSTILYNNLPSYAAAVGKITDGNSTLGQGWIAANGAIVTDFRISGAANNALIDDIFDGYDIIEFNVPPPKEDGTQNHAAPEDQYPLDLGHIDRYIIEGNKSSPDWFFSHFQIKEYEGIARHDIIGGMTILDALPNSTGKTPGERIGEYFQVTRHPSGNTMESRPLETFAYSVPLVDDPLQYNTMKIWNGTALDPADWLRRVNDKDRFIVFSKGSSREFYSSSWHGAPIVYAGSNVAVGIHTYGGRYYHDEFGTGFRDEGMRTRLGNFFGNNMVYVDKESYWPSGNGTIDKPYLTIAEALDQSPAHSVISVTRGHYPEPISLDQAMTLRAPVGEVTIGSSSPMNVPARHLPSELFSDEWLNDIPVKEVESQDRMGLQIFPNPFNDELSISYTVSDKSPVRITVHDILGRVVQTITDETSQKGDYSTTWQVKQEIPNGTYFIKLDINHQVTTFKIIRSDAHIE